MTLTELIEAVRARSPGAMELVREIESAMYERAARRIERRFAAENARVAEEYRKLRERLVKDTSERREQVIAGEKGEGS